MEKTHLVHAFEYLEASGGNSPALAPCTVLHGAEAFLARLVLREIGNRATLDGFSSRYDGPSTDWRDLRDELRTASLFDTGSRVIVVDRADDFISKYRAELEAYAANPANTSKLILVARSLPANTRLAKIIAESGLQIVCELPEKGTKRKTVDQGKVVDWLVRYARKTHSLSIDKGVMQAIFEIVGDNLGLIDQELAKLAVYVEGGTPATKKHVDEIVGGWRARTTWDLMDAITERKPAEALTQLARLLVGGEQPQMIFGALSWWFRRFAVATQHVEWQERQGKKANLEEALLAGGFRKFPPEPFQAAQAQLRRLGRSRAQRLFRDLLSIDLRLKGSHAAPDRARRLLETLIVDLCTTP
jgi:DNA polymerase III subunit delta